MTARRPVRVRKARRASVLACGHYVLVGALIVCRDGRWICIDCALRRPVVGKITKSVVTASHQGTPGSVVGVVGARAVNQPPTPCRVAARRRRDRPEGR